MSSICVSITDDTISGVLASAMKARSLGADAIELRLRYVDSIPREANGKFRAVKSKIGRLNP